MNRRGYVLIIAIIVIVLVIVAIWIIFMIPKGQPSGSDSTSTDVAVSSSHIDYLPQNELPIAITADMPLGSSTQILQNFETNYPNTQQQQSVREYVTGETLAQAYTDYLDYFKKNNWVIISTLNQTSTKSISASMDLVRVDVSFDMNVVLRENVVALMANYYVPSFNNATSVPISTSSIPKNLIQNAK